MIKGYYFITDSGISKRGIIHDVRSAVRSGVGIIQYRAKHLDTASMIKESLLIKKISAGAKLIINDRVDVALATDADGVHIGQNDMDYPTARKLLGKRKIIGVSVSTMNEAVKALSYHPDYIGIGPVYSTRTKKDAGKPIGLTLIKKIRAISLIPIVAIGGITLQNSPKVIAAGANALCAISEVLTKRDVAQEIQKFQALFR